MFPTGVPKQRDTPSPEPPDYLFVFVCQRPPKQEPSYKSGKNISSPSTEPRAVERPTYNGVRPGSPRGSLTTMQPSARYLPPWLG